MNILPKKLSELSLTFVLIVVIACQPESPVAPLKYGISLPSDFEIEKLYNPSVNDQGSWVSITEGPDNRFYTSDQYGGLYTFKMPAIGDTLSVTDIDSVEINMGHAQGLLWAFNSLYVVVVKGENPNKPDDPSSGIYRLTDQDGDGKLDTKKNIISVTGQGEHGPHTLRVSPDGESLYFIAGNFNKVPDQFKSRLPRTWEEDNLLPPYLDASGHANDLKAPGGWLAKTNPDGTDWELIGAGMRNPFSFGINDHGELFAYDADMEWDFGMPWYRPTRILHVTSGAEFGWRTGSGKWPVYSPDNLPAVEDMAQGSPTAVIMGRDLNFPAQYRDGLFACDWSFGTMYHVDLEESGSSYVGEKKEFLSGAPLPITNATAGSDGNLYFLTGGRRLESHLYRVRYTGSEDASSYTASSEPEAEKLRTLRHQLEKYHTGQNPEAIQAAWPYLNHEDRHIQYAARIAIEHQDLQSWQSLLYDETNPTKVIQASLAYARSGGTLEMQITNKLNELSYPSLSEDNQIGLLRAYTLLLARDKTGDQTIKKQIAKRLSPLFPSNNYKTNHSLCELLIHLQSDDAVEKTMALLESTTDEGASDSPDILTKKLLARSEQYGPQIADMLDNMPPTEAIFYATALSHAKKGWTKKLRSSYFAWFENAISKKGGVSYKGFLDNIKSQALSNVPEADKAYFKEIAGFYSPMMEMADLPKPIGPGSNYNMYDLGRIATWGDDKINNYKRTYAEGHRAYQAALCSSCHRMNGEGGAQGPDLSNINTRFNKGEIVNAILVPNKEISDQYAFTAFELKDGNRKVGRIIKETEEAYTIYQSPYDMTATTELLKSDVKSQALSATSPMPAKLLNTLNEDEVLDLVVYLMAGGKADSELYN